MEFGVCAVTLELKFFKDYVLANKQLCVYEFLLARVGISSLGLIPTCGFL